MLVVAKNHNFWWWLTLWWFTRNCVDKRKQCVWTTLLVAWASCGLWRASTLKRLIIDQWLSSKFLESAVCPPYEVSFSHWWWSWKTMLMGICTKFSDLWDAKIEKNIHKKIITHKKIFTWFGNFSTSMDLQRFHYS